MRKTVSSFLAGLIALLVLPTLLAAPAQGAERDVACGGGGTFKIVDTLITSQTNCKGAIVIPADVTGIGFLAFNNSGITAISFEDGSLVKEFTQSFTYGSNELTSIDLPNGLESINQGALMRMKKITTLSIPGTVWNIAYNIFQESNVENVIFEPRIDSRLNLSRSMFDHSKVKSVQFMGPTANGANGFTLGDIAQPAGYRWVGWSEGQGGSIVTFPYRVTEDDGITLYAVGVPQVITTHPCSGGGTFEVRDKVVTSSTANCSGSVSIPADVTAIANYAIGSMYESQAKNITSVTFAEDGALTKIAGSAFGNLKLTSIDLPAGLKELAGGAFQKNNLTSISIPGGVTALGRGFAAGNLSLETVVFEPRTAAFPDDNTPLSALEGLRNLKSIELKGYTSISNDVMLDPRNARGGFNFSHWSTSEGGPAATFPVTTTDPAGITLFLNWTPRTDTANYFSREGTAVAPTSIVGGEITFPTPPTRTGYDFCGWFESGYEHDYGRGCDTENEVKKWWRNSDANLYAQWAFNSEAVNFIVNGGTEMPAGRIHTEQDEWHIPYYSWDDRYTKRVGHNFIGWSLTDGGPAIEFPIRDPFVTEELNLYAKWEIARYRVNVLVYGQGLWLGDDFEYGGTVLEATTPTFQTKNCQAFDRWVERSTEAPITFPHTPGVAEDWWLTAIFKAAPCAVTVAENGAQSVNVPAGVTEAIMPATAQLPEISLNLAGATGDAVVTVAPISNPATADATPFAVNADTKVVDINVAGVTGNVTVCLDGGPTDNVYHFTGGKWEALPERTYANGKVCGVTSNFSPFAAESPKSANNPLPVVVNPAPGANNPASAVDNSAALAAAELAARTVSAKKKYSAKSIANQVGVKTVSPKAAVSISVAKSSKKVCAKSGSSLKTLSAGNCVVIITVQEPKPKGGKKPKATKTTKTLVVQ